MVDAAIGAKKRVLSDVFRLPPIRSSMPFIVKTNGGTKNRHNSIYRPVNSPTV